MAVSLKIDRLGIEEIGQAVALWQSAGLVRPWNDPHADARLALGSPTSMVLAGRLGARLVATAMVGSDGHRGWVYYLAVAHEHRRLGFGRQMMRACEAWISNLGIPKIQLMVRADNTQVAAFYERIGYTVGDYVVLARFLDGNDST